MLSKHLNRILTKSRIQNLVNVPASNTAAVITVNGVTGSFIAVHRIEWSYSGTPASGRLTISDGSTKFDIDITASGPGAMNVMKFGTDASTVTITLAAAGVGITGKLNADISIEPA
jgi:hypothetical protein